ncbi:protein TonB [Mucilaginibacter gracilis]|uniref:Protein TonB n=1 Tax=Mucilaginibacter gracilis TaxID=423350 RepID=A0A495IXP0_9SPHI|nr:energy transducer TonB [Mucilaginibacter gracilis]RKR81467.1 protein TonB [Mucilaginibacter gracilis]
MLGSNLDINSTAWTDVVFKDRNQAYGAYQLRQQNANNTNRALAIATSIFVLALALPTIINWINHFTPKADEIYTVHDYLIEPPIKIEKPQIIKAQPQKQVRAQHDMIRDFPPVVKPGATETPPTDKELEKADPGPQTIKGQLDASPVIDEIAGPKETPGSTEHRDNSQDIFITTEIQPTFPGGEAAFGRFLSDHIRYPAVAKENNISGRVFLQFVVEKDGSLTDMKIINNPGSGLGEEAARVLKTSPRWKPGIQNGKPVRVQFTIPITFNLAE